MHLLPLGKKGLSFGQSSSSRKESSQLKETLIFREAQQARMVLNLEKRVQEISSHQSDPPEDPSQQRVSKHFSSRSRI
jgi:hypothetical protein